MDINTLALSALSLTIILIILFQKMQKKGAIGGKMAPSKALWLGYCILSWFILPIVFIFQKKVGVFTNFIQVLSLSMWIRGVIEIFMLYKTKNWKPIYGIIHNIFTFLIILIPLIDKYPSNNLETMYTISIQVSLLFEIYFAYFFQKYIGIKTQGDKAIWFANKEDPKFKNNLRVTTIANITLYSCLIIFIFN